MENSQYSRTQERFLHSSKLQQFWTIVSYKMLTTARNDGGGNVTGIRTCCHLKGVTSPAANPFPGIKRRRFLFVRRHIHSSFLTPNSSFSRAAPPPRPQAAPIKPPPLQLSAYKKGRGKWISIFPSPFTAVRRFDYVSYSSSSTWAQRAQT